MSKFRGGIVAAEVCKAIGVDPKMVRNIRINLPIDGVATIEFDGYCEIQDITAVSDVFRKYKFVKQPESTTMCIHRLEALVEEELNDYTTYEVKGA